jgi:hypothetical protein
MSKTIVFLNLADMHEHGLAHQSVQSLRRKYPTQSRIYEYFSGANRVYLVDLFGMLEEQRYPTPITSLNSLTAYLPRIEARLAIAQLCCRADKIMLGVHGKFDDTENGFAGLGWERGSGVMGNYKEFATLLASFLAPEQAHRIALVVCFGARAANYKVDHDGNLDEADIKSSFAYKFYKELCGKVNVTMTARTGSVSFDATTGKSLVQTEAAVTAAITEGELQAAESTKQAARAYETLQAFMCTTEEGVQKFNRMLERMEDPAAVPRHPPERIIREYKRIKARVTDLTLQSGADASKYGKFVYSYDAGHVTVMRKYEDGQKVFRVLYHGVP